MILGSTGFTKYCWVIAGRTEFHCVVPGCFFFALEAECRKRGSEYLDEYLDEYLMNLAPSRVGR